MGTLGDLVLDWGPGPGAFMYGRRQQRQAHPVRCTVIVPTARAPYLASTSFPPLHSFRLKNAHNILSRPQ